METAYQPLEPETYHALAQIGASDEWQRLCRDAASALTRDSHFSNVCSAKRMLTALLNLREFITHNPDAIHTRLVRLINSDVQIASFVWILGR